MTYWLRYKGTLFPVHPGDSLLGRSPECLIVLASERVSREHAVVRRIHCGLEVEDLGSRNGTWVNGTRIRRATVLQPGDEVQLGEDVLEVVVKSNARVPVTVPGVSATLVQHKERQRQLVTDVEAAIDRVLPGDDHAAVAHELRPVIDELINDPRGWGIALSTEEARRLSNAALTLADWAKSLDYERWARDLAARLSRVTA